MDKFVSWLVAHTTAFVDTWTIDKALRILLRGEAVADTDFQGAREHLFRLCTPESAVQVNFALHSYYRSNDPNPDQVERVIYRALGLEPPQVPLLARLPDSLVPVN